MIQKHSVVISGHATSISLETAFWRRLKAMAERDGISLAALIAHVDASRATTGGGLSSALRVCALEDALKDKLS
ncbi:MAG TPA: aryl-sulfate sulfotransferase [Rhodospirillaceae bacterium]|nr:MAG: hypothetical protein A2018_03190 [Alphaproteobacteria bacterium GWF2_58_20]HAU29349.1 aryl-sulfate sulfotransferase [Rhodospirillaceae bacterium]